MLSQSTRLRNNTIGSYNTADGLNALFANTSGNDNTATGLRALYGNSTGSENTAVGVSALAINEDGSQNTAIGYKALMANRGGNHNIALGHEAGINVGRLNNPRDNNIEIGNSGDFFDNATIRIGDVQTKTFIAGISGAAVAGNPVVVDANGQLGTATSSARFKKEIKPMDTASEAILALKPVSFQYKSDPTGARQFGLIAEEVAKVNPDLVTRDRNGEIYSVRYEAVNAMLLNEFLKEHRTVQEQKATITELKSTVAQQQKDFQATAAHQQKQIEALTAGLQKVSTELATVSPSHGGLEASKFATGGIRGGGPAPQLVNNNP